VRRDRVLVLCEHAPWPRNDRTSLRNYWLIDALAKKYALDLVVANEASPIPPTFASIVEDYASFPVTQNERARNAALHEYVANRLGNYPYAAIQIELPMAPALPRRDVIPLVYNAHYSQSSILSRMPGAYAAALEPDGLMNALRLRIQERVLINRSALVLTCSEVDADRFERCVPGVRSRMAVVHDGVSVLDFSPLRAISPKPKSVLVAGSEPGRPNVAGVQWFLDQVRPHIAAVSSDVTISVAGGAELDKLAGRYPDVSFVPDPLSGGTLLAGATIVAIPVIGNGHSGAYIHEASAAGRPVITTGAGAAGLDYVPNVDVTVADQPAAFAQALISMLARPDVRTALTENASKRVAAHEWTRIGEQLRSLYDRFASEATPLTRVATVSGETVLSGRT
jgi:glycosyltransferase involved in cell wall biosynthesis